MAWEWEGEERFDVVLTGYRDLVAASSAVVSLEEAGWFPEVIPLRELPPAAAAP